MKERGNACFKNKDFTAAVKQYELQVALDEEEGKGIFLQRLSLRTATLTTIPRPRTTKKKMSMHMLKEPANETLSQAPKIQCLPVLIMGKTKSGQVFLI